MTSTAANVSVKIMSKEFQVICPPGTEDALFDAAQYLDTKMQEIQRNGRVIGSERIAIMAALNIAHELLTQKHEKDLNFNMVSQKLQHLQKRIDTVVIKPKPPELESL